MDEALYQLIQSKTPITDIIGGRFYPLIRQGNSVPAATYRKIPSMREYNYDGEINLQFQNYDCHFYASDYGVLQNLVETFSNEISESSGSYGGKQIDYVWTSEFGHDDYLEEQELYTDMIEIKIAFN